MFEDLVWHEEVSTWNEYKSVYRLTKVDDRTVHLESEDPTPGLELKLITWQGGDWLLYQPKHYLQKWHIEHNPDANAIAKEEGFDNWAEALHAHFWWTPTLDKDKPTLHAWRFAELKPTTRIWERNPYYWKVDTANNQLPYVDRVVSTVVEQDVYTLKIISGEADVAFVRTSLDDFALYKENEDQGGYRVVLLPGLNGSDIGISLNLNHPEQWRAELYQDLRFRQAVSMAINRDEVNEAAFFGLAVPRQTTTLPQNSYYKDEWETVAADYDPDTANELLDELGLTEKDRFGIRIVTILFAYAVAIPIGIYSATHQYSLGDYGFTVLGFVGLATPNFLLALLLMYVLLKLFGISAGGLFSPAYEFEPWSVARVVDALLHLPLPVLVAGTAAIVRVMRSTLLDELKKQYVITARAKGVDEHRLVMKYPVRVALNPIIATAGWLLPEIVSGSTIVAIVLSLPTVAPLLLRALTSQDSYLAGSIIMVLGVADRHRHPDFRPGPGGHGSAHPLRAQMMRTLAATRDPAGVEERYFLATQWQLMGRRFRSHKLALIGAAVLVLLYVTTLLGEFSAPYDSFRRFADYPFAPPQRLRFIDQGRPSLRPFVYGYERFRDPESLRWRSTVDRSLRYPISFLVHGDEYFVLGLFATDLHLFGVAGEGAHVFLFGTDKLGRDLFSRNIRAARISLTIGLVGVAISFLLGCTLGGISGYYGGAVDTLIQRVVEFLISIPSIPLWMALAASLPNDWPPIRVYFGITIILSVISWTSLARVVRSKLLELREADFVMAAKIAGAREAQIVRRHLLPSFLSYLIVSLTLSIPAMILGETALSFLGIGIQPPALSWGALLQSAQNVRSVALAPWLFIPGLFIVVTVLAYNFVGDGLRDAADPYT